MTWLFKLRKTDRFIFSLQETHLNIKDLSLVQALWREGTILSPSTGKARGVLTMFSNNLFDNLLHTSGTPDGRITCVIGEFNSNVDILYKYTLLTLEKMRSFTLLFLLKSIVGLLALRWIMFIYLVTLILC
jgi:hypothetical protein